MKKIILVLCALAAVFIVSGCSAGENPYSSVTEMSKNDVEAFAKDAKDAYVAQDWEKLSDMISYPVQVGPDRNLKDKKEFLSYMKGRKADKASIDSMKKESCSDMFVNGDGICMADGMLWLFDESYDPEGSQGEPSLKIYSINGIKQ